MLYHIDFLKECPANTNIYGSSDMHLHNLICRTTQNQYQYRYEYQYQYKKRQGNINKCGLFDMHLHFPFAIHSTKRSILPLITACVSSVLEFVFVFMCLYLYCVFDLYFFKNVFASIFYNSIFSTTRPRVLSNQFGSPLTGIEGRM